MIRRQFANSNLESGSYYSSIDFIASEPEFQDLLEEKAMSSAGLSNGVQGDRRGRAFERHVVNTMKHKGNLIRLKVGTTSNESGYSFALFKLITEAAGVNPSQIEAMSDEEVFRFVLDKWNDLRFSPAVDAKQPKKADNPKRRQREAAKTAAEPKPSTKAQAAIAEMREHQKAEARKRKSDTKRANEETKFAARQAKRKQKHRGH